ncbi:group II intron reverse transcriptase/maturase [Kutzneria sp. NPDC052558]|uniref:reverse transcriptase/maturase family protein n=1 Tax=Kutzneria sp. NPDC052558 TaxID=3364121 RepID=UPI0037CA39F9
MEGDISDCFGSLDHNVMITTLAEKIHDSRFLRLLRNMLKAGYLEDWTWGVTLSGAPQGGVVSPILSNIYLHKLDEFVETVLVPEYTRGHLRARNPPYVKVAKALERARERGDRAQARTLRQQLHTLPSKDPQDPHYRRLRYNRYADDHLLGFTGPRAEAEAIKQRLADFLRDELKLELSPNKTLITHARTRAARYLGYEISVQHSDTTLTQGQRQVNGTIRLSVPTAVITTKCAPYQVRGKPARRSALTHFDDYDIVRTCGAEYRGIVQYYLLAHNVSRLSRLQWVAETAMLKTLAAKHNSTVSKMAARYKAKITTPHGMRTCFEASRPREGKKPLVARFGGIPLTRQRDAVLTDRIPTQIGYARKELITRLLNGQCELCQKTDHIQVHQVRSLADLTRSGTSRPAWMATMARKRRKTLVVCQSCHDLIHSEQPTAQLTA